VLSPQQSPYLANKIGDDIVTASGTTLLGADDKAGVAIVMAMARHLLAHPEIPHGPMRIGFTPDEEIGRGVHKNLPADLGATFAYTLDGADLGEIVYETFSADKATVRPSRAFPRTPATPRTSWSTRCTWRPRSSTRCRTSR
jgi:tripeptide aminopeptidase